jgi:hypothetical protein
MHNYGLNLISKLNVLTHNNSNILDLAFSDVPIVKAITNKALYFILNYKTLRIVIPIIKDYNRRPENKKWIILKNRLPELIDIVKNKTYKLPSLSFSIKKLDYFAKVLVNII